MLRRAKYEETLAEKTRLSDNINLPKTHKVSDFESDRMLEIEETDAKHLPIKA
jgi:hypothetical protein